LEELRKRYSCIHLALKEPALTPFFPLVDELLPNQACYLCLVRDPRDAIASMLRWGKQLESTDSNHFFKSRDIEYLSSFFMHYYAFMLSENEAFFRRLLLIKYEELVNKPHQVLKKIRNFTSLAIENYSPATPWKEGLLDYRNQKGPVGPAVSKLFGQPISNESIGSYKDVLTSEESKTIQICCREIFDLFGYTIEHTTSLPESKSDFLKKVPLFDENHELMRLRAKARQYDDVLAELKELRGKAKNYDEIKDELPALRSKAKEHEKLAKEMMELRSKDRQYDDMLTEVRELRSKAKNYDEIKNELSKLRSKAGNYDQIKDELPALRSKAKQYDKLAEELPRLKSKAKEYDKLADELPRLRSKAKQYDKLADELPGLRSKAKHYDELSKEVLQLRSKAKQLDELMKEVPKLRYKGKRLDEVLKDQE